LDWDDLRVFLGVARERTLSGAARKLRVDQSTVGRRLAALEAAAGARLFERTPVGYALTAAAEEVLASVQQIEAVALTVERKLLGQDTRVEGRVKLATSDSLATWFLMRHLPALRGAHPGVVIELVTGNQPVDLARREADVSLRLTKPKQANLIARRLGIAAWAPYAAESYLRAHGKPSARSHYAGHDVIGFDPELAGTIGAQWLSKHAARARVALTTNSLTCHAQAVTAGLGVSPLPCLFGDNEPSLQRLAPGVFGHHELWLVVHPDLHESARVRAVLDFLTTLVRDQTALLSGKLGARTSAARAPAKAKRVREIKA
jgi:DNA-binding transcriptional LysR family regulator